MSWEKLLAEIFTLAVAIHSVQIALNIYRNSKTGNNIYLRIWQDLWGQNPQIYLEMNSRLKTPILISAAGFLLPDEGKIFFPQSENNNFPFTLPPRQKIVLKGTAGDLTEFLRQHGFRGAVKLRGFYLDERNVAYVASRFFRFKLSR